ncbi:cellulose biosynthesis protein BcsG [Solimonas flava]|uniref:cellulose biosynthesis protein BcsG n=1 Tax=Solimonas flava TaxID=415849 RepID=UPI00040FDA5C|nr:cellulose biosynthesis protein BcsG [Solimonas flava]
MGFWSFYFFAKLLLYYRGDIGFHVLYNLGFAALTAWPLRRRWLRVSRQVLAVPLGLSLLYYDSFLPPIRRVLATAGDVMTFSGAYLLELASRFFNPHVALGLVALLLVWLLLAHRLRMATFAVIGILSVPAVGALQQLRVAAPAVATSGAPGVAAPAGATEPLTDASLTARLQAFYASEAPRRVRFTPPPADSAPFDVLIVHVCSLAWDDLQYVGAQDHALIKRFDLLLRNFNTAASYSGPAAIRVLRSACGQTSHAALYKPDPPECHLMADLAAAGFEPHWTMNHDGHFGDFVGDVRANLGVAASQDVDPGARVAMHAFDGSPIYDDYDVLSRWWQKRQALPASRVALFYNTVTLHDGNRIDGYRPANSHDSYQRRVTMFLDDIGRFFDLVAQSGRRAVVVVVPEHGAAVRGDRMQISGLREIPTPAITLAPVGVKLIGPGYAAQPQRAVETPTALLAVAQLLENLIADAPFAGGEALAAAAANLPQTEAVSENEQTVLMRVGSDYQMRTPDGAWTRYDTRSDQ